MRYECYPEKYITNQGETWDMISLDFYGSPYKIKELVDCNPQYSEVLVFDGNIELSIPILEDDAEETLAPWKRGA